MGSSTVTSQVCTTLCSELGQDTITNTVPTTTVVTTTGIATTGTFITTTTAVQTITLTSTATETSTTTFTETSSSSTTSVVPTIAGFVPIEDSTGRKDAAPQKKRELLAEPIKKNLAARGLVNAGHPHVKRTAPDSRPQYPKSATCVRYVKVRIIVKLIIYRTPVTQTAPAYTSTVNVPNTVTSTSTIIPPGVTETITSTDTSTSTATITATTTVTSSTTVTVTEVSTATSYAACAPNNLLGPKLDDGFFINGYSGSAKLDYQKAYAGNAYDCCVICNTNPNCVSSEYLPNYESCAIRTRMDGGTCDNANFVAARISEGGQPSQYSSTGSNGPCGQVGSDT
ncbi:MAG: hypothetical protein L6R37_004786 [Teloschistes peruensis]|nr:MAG: hypothetical protein L6R37_004786 [Teloschistes peruensis]